MSHIYGSQYKYQAPLTLTIFKYTALIFAIINIMGIDRMYYLRWQNIDRMTPIEFVVVKPRPLYYIVRENWGIFETWVQLFMAIINYIALYVCILVSIMESHYFMKL